MTGGIGLKTAPGKQFWRSLCIAAAAAVLAACATSQAGKVEEDDPFAGVPVADIVAAGDTAMRQGEFDRAIFIYMQAVEIEESADNWYRVGIAKIRLDDNEFAWNAFRKALELDPDHAPTHEDLGLLYVSMGQPEQAVRHLRKATELDPKRWRAHNALGVIADVDEQYAKAVGHYKAALEQFPDSAMLMNNIGYSYYLSGDLEQATRWLDAAVQAQPGYELAIRNLALLYARQGWYEEAVATFIKVVEKPKAYNDVGYIALRNGDFDAAGLLLTEAIRLSPRYYETAYENLERLEAAIEAAGERKERAELEGNMTEVVFADGHQSQSRTVMPQALNVRSAPSLDSEIIDYLKTGDPVEVLVSRDSWAFISYRPAGVLRDLTGWVRSRYLANSGTDTSAASQTDMTLPKELGRNSATGDGETAMLSE
jgi:Flp pilus assembly protein TadD